MKIIIKNPHTSYPPIKP